jgi:hypothetical protein
MCVLFNTNMDLVNDWRLEQNFTLYFFSGLIKQENEYKIEISEQVFLFSKFDWQHNLNFYCIIHLYIANRNSNEIVSQPVVSSTKHKSSKYNIFEMETDTDILSLIKTKFDF